MDPEFAVYYPIEELPYKDTSTSTYFREELLRAKEENLGIEFWWNEEEFRLISIIIYEHTSDPDYFQTEGRIFNVRKETVNSQESIVFEFEDWKHAEGFNPPVRTLSHILKKTSEGGEDPLYLRALAEWEGGSPGFSVSYSRDNLPVRPNKVLAKRPDRTISFSDLRITDISFIDLYPRIYLEGADIIGVFWIYLARNDFNYEKNLAYAQEALDKQILVQGEFTSQFLTSEFQKRFLIHFNQ